MDRFAAVRRKASAPAFTKPRSEEHTSELQSHSDLVCRLLLEKKKLAVLIPYAGRIGAWFGFMMVGYIVGVLAAIAIPAYQDYTVFFFNGTATTEIYTLSLHDALPICPDGAGYAAHLGLHDIVDIAVVTLSKALDRKSTRLNSSHTVISYAVFCLK